MPACCTPDPAALLGPQAQRSREMAELWAELVERQAGLPNWLDLAPAEARAAQSRFYALWNDDLPEVASLTPVRLPGTPEIAAELIVPRQAGPGCILFLHGGGWAFGSLRSHDRFTRLLATVTRSRVLSVDYRLAPEHPCPAAIEDAGKAWRWLAARAATDPDCAGPLVIAGDSAGANLGFGLMLEAQDRGWRRPDLALLFYGVYTADLDSPSYVRFAEGFGLTRAGMARFWDWYAPPDRPALRTDPRVACLAADASALKGVPPLFLNAAGLDPLLSDTLRLAEKLCAARLDHQCVVHTGVHHGFMQMSGRLAEAREAFDLAADFYRSRLGGK